MQNDFHQEHEEDKLQNNIQEETRAGKVRYAVAAWLVGLPLPFILIALFVRGCDW